MGLLRFISRIRDGIAIFLLLSLCELVLADMSANYIIIFGPFGYLPFTLGSVAVLLLAFGDLAWCALRLEPGIGCSGFVKAGAAAGLACSIAACALVSAFSFLGAGVAQLLLGRHVQAFLLIIISCTALGALAGMVASWALLSVEGKIRDDIGEKAGGKTGAVPAKKTGKTLAKKIKKKKRR